jgi:hypothetical protein
MQTGCCALTLVPVRAEPSDRSELVNQLLFGERWTLDREEGDWLRIRGALDGYEGWIDRKQATWAAGPWPSAEGREACSLELVHAASSADRQVPLVLGSSLPGFDGMNFRLPGEKFVYHGQATDPAQPPSTPQQLLKVGMKFLGAPYLWGGRSPFGVDCSGLVQVLFKVAGMALPRDASQQVSAGEPVEFAHAAREGDLAFFDNEEGRITHVGLVAGPGRILHASGRVRLDALDQQGIYDAERKRYSHRLRTIKRLL